jgi:hypothetical protein
MECEQVKSDSPAYTTLEEEVQKFAKVKWTAEIANKSSSVFFVHHHFWEAYDHEKAYGSELFKQDYGHGMLTYEWVLYHTGDDRTSSYAAVQEVLSEDDRKTYASFCTCNVCRSGFWEHLFSIQNGADLGCLKCDPSDHGFTFSQAVIDTSRSEFYAYLDINLGGVHSWLCGFIDNAFEELPQNEL